MLEYDEAELEVEKPIEIHWLKPWDWKKGAEVILGFLAFSGKFSASYLTWEMLSSLQLRDSWSKLARIYTWQEQEIFVFMFKVHQMPKTVPGT